MNYKEIRRSVGRDLFEIFIFPVDSERLRLDAGVAIGEGNVISQGGSFGWDSYSVGMWLVVIVRV